MRFLMCLAALPSMSKETLTRKGVKKKGEKIMEVFFQWCFSFVHSFEASLNLQVASL